MAVQDKTLPAIGSAIHNRLRRCVRARRAAPNTRHIEKPPRQPTDRAERLQLDLKVAVKRRFHYGWLAWKSARSASVQLTLSVNPPNGDSR